MTAGGLREGVSTPVRYGTVPFYKQFLIFFPVIPIAEIE
jgi:hypothetical protein